MTTYLCLARGPNDAALEWPFINRTMKVSIVEQQANAMDALNAIMFVEAAEYSVSKWKRPFRVWKYRKTSQRTFLNALALLMVISHISSVIRNVDITSQE